MHNWIWVGLGGFVGAVCRYFVSRGLHDVAIRRHIPLATIAVNIAGCLLIGVLATLIHDRWQVPEAVRSLVLVGLLGSFTTYSTFSYEAVALIQSRELLSAGLYLGIHLAVGLGAVLAGMAGGHAIADAL